MAYNYWFNFAAAMRVTERPLGNLNAQRLHINYVYGEVHAKIACCVGNYFKPAKADEAEATVPVHVCNDAELNWPTTLRAERDDEFPS